MIAVYLHLAGVKICKKADQIVGWFLRADDPGWDWIRQSG
jgi:hypothetical protein